MKWGGKWPWRYVGSFIVVLLTLFPIYLMLKISLSPPQEVLTPHPSIGVHGITPEHWKTILNSEALWPPSPRVWR